MKPSHHISRTRLYLKYAASDTAAGDYDRAAKALARATSHAATAVGIHWDYLTGLRGSRRRLQTALYELAYKRYVSYGLAGVLRDAYALPDRIQAALTKPTANAANPNAAKPKAASPDAAKAKAAAVAAKANAALPKPGAAKAKAPNCDAAAHQEIIHLLRRTRMRARRLLKAILKAMADEPNPPTFAQILARALAASPDPKPVSTPGAGARVTPPPAPPPLCISPPPPPPASDPPASPCARARLTR